MLERLAQLIVINVVACGACSGQSSGGSGQSSGDPQRATAGAAAVFAGDSSEAVIAHSASRNAAVVGEADCPGDSAETPQIPGSPLWLQSYAAPAITSVTSDSRGEVVFARSGVEVVKLSCDGSLLWSHPFGSQVAVDDQDGVYVAGTFSGTLGAGESALSTTGTEAFLVKLDSDGNIVYARALGEAADGAVESLAVDSGHHVAISGPGLGTVKLDENGDVLWQKAFSGKLRFDSAQNLLLSGELVGTLDFGAGTLTSRGGSDILLLKLAPDGTPLFARSFGDAGALQRAEAIAVDAEDNVVIAGTFDGRIDFGVGALELTPAQCSADAWCVTDGFVAKLDPQGQAIWSAALGPMRAVSGAAIDHAGNSVLSGALPGGVRPFRQTWLATLDPNGVEAWHRSEWPDTGIGAGHGIAIDRDGRIFWSLSARPSLELEEQSYLVKLTP